jgi:hypothetical protein
VCNLYAQYQRDQDDPNSKPYTKQRRKLNSKDAKKTKTQDWNYVAGGTMAITLELSDNKWRPTADLPTLWDENQDALLALPLAAMFSGKAFGGCECLFHSCLGSAVWLGMAAASERRPAGSWPHPTTRSGE